MSNLSISVTAEISDLQAKFAVARAEANALAAEMRKLAQQSAAGVLDPAGEAQLRQVAADFVKAQGEARNLSREMREVTATSGGIGEAVEDLRGKLNAAFEVSGAAIALETIKQIGEAIEHIGAQAVEIKSGADILGVSVEQFQAMRVAAEEAGVSVEAFTHGSERFISLLTEARDNSGAAADKLLALGISAAQIRDPAFKLNDLFAVLHERLTDSATSQQTMNELVRELGPRAAGAAEALKRYDGSAEAVAEVLSKINGLSQKQTDILARMKAEWAEVTSAMGNYAAKALAGAGDAWEKLQEAMGVESGPGVGKYSDEAQDRKDKGAERAQADLQREMAQQELQNIQAGLEAFKAGTQERLNQLKIYAEAAQQYYGSAEVDTVRKANNEIIAAHRELNAQLLQQDEQQRQQFTRNVERDAQFLTQQLAQNLDEQFRDTQKTLQNEAKLHDEYIAKVAKDQELMRRELNKDIDEQEKKWRTLSNTITSGLGGAISEVITGARTMSEAFRSAAAGMADAFAKQAAQNVASIAAEAVGVKGIRSEQIREDAGAAAAGAYKAIVGIPYVGPILAPAAAAVAYSAVLAFDSAEGGYDIPAGLNPMVQTHAREMILPANIADHIRNSMSTSGPGEGGGSAGRKHVFVQPQMVGGMLAFTPANLKKMLEDLGHRGHFPGGMV